MIGIRIERFADESARRKHSQLIAKANKWMSMLPSTFPGSRITTVIGYRYLKKARALEANHRSGMWVRARKGVVLSAGGFICNPAMVQHFAPEYAKGMPNGTLGDQGAGIYLGKSVGGQTALMEKISAWRFINPPKAWANAIVVNRKGERFVDETVYGATLGEHIGDHQGGIAYVVYDAAARKTAFKQAMDPVLVPFQRDVTLLNLMFNYKKAGSLDELAGKIGFDAATLKATVDAYNRSARGEQADAFEKDPKDMIPLEQGPFYAMDISVASRFLPLPVISFGGLRIEEESGLVLDTHGKPIAGLYAAGRTAVGIASQTYVSGLSYADCVYSGRRAARHVAKANV